MTSIESPRVTSCNSTQSLNVVGSISFNLSDITTLDSELQPSKAEDPKNSSPLGKMIVFREVQLIKAFLSIKDIFPSNEID